MASRARIRHVRRRGGQIAQGGLSVNGARVTCADGALPEPIDGRYLVLRAGKKRLLIARKKSNAAAQALTIFQSSQVRPHDMEQALVLGACPDRQSEVSAQRVGRPERSRDDARVKQRICAALRGLVIADANKQKVGDARRRLPAKPRQLRGEPVPFS